MKKNLKKYELKIKAGTDAKVSALALVEDPAIESNFLSFSKQFKKENFAANDEKMELLGAAMIPDQLIYRVDKKTNEEFEVYFSTETIREIAQQYFRSGYQNNLNLNHSAIPAKSFIYQSFIVDSSKGITPPKGIDVPDGSWIVGVKVEDPLVWKDIKLGKQKGFSIEGMFDFMEIELSSNKTDDEAEDLIILNLLRELKRITKNKN